MIRIILIGRDLDDYAEQIGKNRKEIEFLSVMSGEQTKLLASLAIVQNDIAQSIDKKKTLLEEEEYITLKIPLASDEFTN